MPAKTVMGVCVYAAAVGVGADMMERASALVNAKVDVIVIDTCSWTFARSPEFSASIDAKLSRN